MEDKLAYRTKVIIVEDDILYSVQLEMMLKELHYNVLKKCDNATEAEYYIRKYKPDIVFMDIDLVGDRNGLTLGEDISDLNIPIIYLTSYETKEHYQKAKENNTLAYLTKPLSTFTLKTSIELAIKNSDINQVLYDSDMENVRISDNHIYLRVNDSLDKYTYDSIAALKSENVYTSIMLNGNEKNFLVRAYLTEIESLLPEEFVKVHRSYVINLKHIQSVNYKTSTILINGYSIPLSRSKKKGFQEKFEDFNQK